MGGWFACIRPSGSRASTRIQVISKTETLIAHPKNEDAMLGSARKPPCVLETFILQGAREGRARWAEGLVCLNIIGAPNGAMVILMR